MRMMILVGYSAVKEKNEVQLNHEEVIKDDFSSITDNYVNTTGDVIPLAAENIKKRLIEIMRCDKEYSYISVLTSD